MIKDEKIKELMRRNKELESRFQSQRNFSVKMRAIKTDRKLLRLVTHHWKKDLQESSHNLDRPFASTLFTLDRLLHQMQDFLLQDRPQDHL